MTDREELVVALAQADAARQYLEAALAEAKAALADTVANSYEIDPNQEKARAAVEKARARCRQLRAALANPRPEEIVTRSRERFETTIKRTDEIEKRAATAKPPATQTRKLFVGAASKTSKREPIKRRLFRQFDIYFSSQKYSFGYLVKNTPLIRHSIGLLALTLAYLFFFQTDVQLEIVNLPSLVTYLLR